MNKTSIDEREELQQISDSLKTSTYLTDEFWESIHRAKPAGCSKLPIIGCEVEVASKSLFSRCRLWVARLLHRMAKKLERPITSEELIKLAQPGYFSLFFPPKYFPDGPPPRLSSGKGKGITPARVVEKRAVGDLPITQFLISGDDVDHKGSVWVESEPTRLVPKRKDFGDVNNTLENIAKRNPDVVYIPAGLSQNEQSSSVSSIEGA